MNILYLGPDRPAFIAYLQSLGDRVVRIEHKLTADSQEIIGADWIVSFGYRYILKDDLLGLFPNRAINLHISHLPWNRGADPNLWSWIENTPKGVTIHQIDPGIDTGLLLAQRLVDFDGSETLQTSYEKLTGSLEQLFREYWPDIRSGRRRGFRQPEGGTSHRLRDREAVAHLLYAGWDTPVRDLIGRSAETRQEAANHA